MGRRVVLHSPLDPVALATRLRQVLGGRDAKPKKGIAAKGVSGQGSEQDMMLFVRRASGAVSATRFNATMEPHEGGTRIDGRFGVARGMECGLILWCGFLSIFIATGYAITTGGGALEVGIPFMAIPGVMMIVPIALWWFGNGVSATDMDEVLQFLRDTVQAQTE